MKNDIPNSKNSAAFFCSIICAMFIAACMPNVVYSILSTVQEDLKLDSISWITTITQMVIILTYILLIRWKSWNNTLARLSWGFIINLVASGLLFFANSELMFIIGRAMQGISVALILSVSYPLFEDYYKYSAISESTNSILDKAKDAHALCYTLTFAFSGLIAGVVIKWFSWKVLFALSCFASLVGIILLLRAKIRNLTYQEPDSDLSWIDCLKDLWQIYLIQFLHNSSFGVFILVVLHLNKEYELSVLEVGVYVFFMGIPSLIVIARSKLLKIPKQDIDQVSKKDINQILFGLFSVFIGVSLLCLGTGQYMIYRFPAMLVLSILAMLCFGLSSYYINRGNQGFIGNNVTKNTTLRLVNYLGALLGSLIAVILYEYFIKTQGIHEAALYSFGVMLVFNVLALGIAFYTKVTLKE